MNFPLKFKILQKFGSQADFALAIGLSESGLSRIVHERREPEPELRATIAKKLGCEPHEVFPS